MLDPQAAAVYSLIHQKGIVSCMTFTLRRLCADDLAAADQLRADLGWNQTILDWQRLLTLSPDGCFVAEQNAGIVETCTTVTHDKALAWIGMAVVYRASRRQGVAKAWRSRQSNEGRTSMRVKINIAPGERLGMFPVKEIVLTVEIEE